MSKFAVEQEVLARNFSGVRSPKPARVSAVRPFRRSEWRLRMLNAKSDLFILGALGDSLFGSNLAGVRGARHVGHSKGFYPGCGYRGIFHLSTYANAAAFIGAPRAGEQRESASLARHAGCTFSPEMTRSSSILEIGRLR